jgi:hypothetical protein
MQRDQEWSRRFRRSHAWRDKLKTKGWLTSARKHSLTPAPHRIKIMLAERITGD